MTYGIHIQRVLTRYALFYQVILLNASFAQELSMNTLSQFLIENEGKRCVVVLDVRSQRFRGFQRKLNDK